MSGLMSPAPTASSTPTKETCGNCRWGRRVDQMLGPQAQVECYGVPPTAIPIGQTANGLQIMTTRPVLEAQTPRCGLWGPAQRILQS
jgi:hypothetical protein